MPDISRVMAAMGIIMVLVGIARAVDPPQVAPQPRPKATVDRQLTDVPPIPIRGAGSPATIMLAGDVRSTLPRFHFTIDPSTPVDELLPTPPAVQHARAPLMTDDLRQVTEIEFQGR